MTRPVTILGFASSLRKNSFNKAILRAAVELAPKDAKLEIFDLEGIPPFNQDLETQILIATPEYNYSIPGVLKVIDWASRPYPDNSFEGKPVALIGLY